MANEPINTDLNAEEYLIGYQNNGAVMVVSIPLRKWAEDDKYGDIKVSGTFTKAERIALKNLQMMRSEKQEKKIVVPPNIIPMPTGRPA
jgi:hypothetical protein